ncbi:MAG: hypothetical protein GC159_08035 [Phycisphaera sp.]|nr:hypothetical protein [Phycisphaera sp.]
MASNAPSNPPLFERRTLVVLTCLIFSLTAVSGLLLSLEPQPLAPASGTVLTAFETNSVSIESMLASEPAAYPGRWKAIIVHHSGQPYGDAQTLSQLHQDMGYGGLAYHFVIGNGDGADDGQIQVGYRWTRQLDAAGIYGVESAAWFNHHAIHICLIGNGDRAAPTQAQMDQLVKLVRVLQNRFGIPAEHVLLAGNVAPTTSPGLLFPGATFRGQLIN